MVVVASELKPSRRETIDTVLVSVPRASGRMTTSSRTAIEATSRGITATPTRAATSACIAM